MTKIGKLSVVLLWLALCVTAGALDVHSQSAGSGYLEPGACARCHSEIAESYARTGMARSFGRVSPENTFPELTTGSFKHEASEELFTVYTREGKAYPRRHQIGFDGSIANVFDVPIDYWFGSGSLRHSYRISRRKSGELVELPITWYAENGGHWAMSPGYDRADHAGFTRRITYRCMFCHNSYPELPPEAAAWEGGTSFPNQLGEGIDCQRCHGPGQAHVDAVRQGLSSERVRRAIVNPARLSPDRQMEVCMQCHLETTSLKLPASLLRCDRGVFSYRGRTSTKLDSAFRGASRLIRRDRFEFVSAAHRLRTRAASWRAGKADLHNLPQPLMSHLICCPPRNVTERPA
jgi:hypothetical protein